LKDETMSKSTLTVVSSIWAHRRLQARTLTAALKKREMALIELTDDELQKLARADAVAREMRLAEEKAK
jgi:hypothetical protein